VRVRFDALPDALWGSTAGAHACGACREHYKNIARLFNITDTPAVGPASVSNNPF